jgi:adenosine phosphosulfate reductase beta subunit
VLGVLLLRQDLPAGRHRSRHYADIVPLGGSVQPMRGSDSIMWTIKFRNGTLKRFKFPIRTTAEGSIDPYGGKPMPKMSKSPPMACSPAA